MNQDHIAYSQLVKLLIDNAFEKAYYIVLKSKHVQKLIQEENDQTLMWVSFWSIKIHINQLIIKSFAKNICS